MYWRLVLLAGVQGACGPNKRALPTKCTKRLLWLSSIKGKQNGSCFS